MISETPLHALVARLEAVAAQYRKPGYVSSDVLFAQALDPIIKELAALLLTAGPQEYAQHIENRCVEAKDEGLCEATDGIRSQWFIQGGEAQFGAISGVTADELVSSILEAVRGTAGPQETPQGWQPIETAPKDGTLILTACGDDYRLTMWVEYAPTRLLPKGISQWSTGYGPGAIRELDFQPTHWMALHAPPQCGTPCETEGQL